MTAPGRWIARLVCCLLPAAAGSGPTGCTAAPHSPPREWADVPGFLARLRSPEFPKREFDIVRYGAVPDGRSDSLPALRAAIAACAAAGGGRVTVPPGNFYLKGPIVLASRVELHLAAGSLLRFSGRPEDFLPLVLTRWEGTLLYNYSPLITAHGAEDIAITGAGTIDGNARAAFLDWIPRQEPGRERLRRMGAEGTPVAERHFGPGWYIRPGMVEPFECRRVLIEGITLRDSPFWTVHPIFCSDVTVRAVTVDSTSRNNDGCDPDSCRNVLIENCRFHTGDDGIAIKAGRDADAWRDGRGTENVVIRGCVFRAPFNGVCIGSEMSGGVRRVFVEDCRVEEGNSCIYFKSNRDRGGAVEDVRVRRVRIERAHVAAIRFETNYHGYRGGNAPSTFRDIVIEDVACARSEGYGILIDGNPDNPIRDVRLRRLALDGVAAPVWLRHFSGLELQEVRINGALFPAHPPATPPAVLRLKVAD